MKEEQLTAHIRVRVTPSTKAGLKLLAKKRGPGSKVGDLVREAIHQVYFGDDPTGGERIADVTPPQGPHPITEITTIRSVEKRKKSNGG